MEGAMKINLGKLLGGVVSTVGPIAVPIIIAAVSGAVAKPLNKVVAKAQRKALADDDAGR
jgi:hypothetical protein